MTLCMCAHITSVCVCMCERVIEREREKGERGCGNVYPSQ